MVWRGFRSVRCLLELLCFPCCKQFLEVCLNVCKIILNALKIGLRRGGKVNELGIFLSVFLQHLNV
jgi:hypothetical protein